MDTTTLILIILFSVSLFFLIVFAFLLVNDKKTRKNTEDKDSYKIPKQDYESLLSNLERLKAIESQKKSSEVRTGLIAEQLAPFLDNFDGDPKNLYFIGKPIDYIEFDYDKKQINFIEIKSGRSRLSNNQKVVKEIVKNSNFAFKEIRINQDGLSNKIDKPNPIKINSSPNKIKTLEQELEELEKQYKELSN